MELDSYLCTLISHRKYDAMNYAMPYSFNQRPVMMAEWSMTLEFRFSSHLWQLWLIRE